MAKKGLKVTNLSRKKKFGVAAETLKEFIIKSCEKLMVKDDWRLCRCYVAEDGTLVGDEEYFQTLPSQTLLVVVQPNEDMKTDFEHFYELIRLTKLEYLKAGQFAQDFLSKNFQDKLKKILEQVDRDNEEKLLCSLRGDDPDWFEGIDTNVQTKEAVMSRKAKDRIRGYFYKTKQLLITSDIYINSYQNKSKAEIDSFMKNLQRMLEANIYNCFYFDRGAKEYKRLCDKKGQFDCSGIWNQDQCKYIDTHFINPYRSREERILFQTWNLDHRIELSRSIVPSILKAAEELQESVASGSCHSCGISLSQGHISANWYFKVLFTVDNLRLVHIVCHDKGKHGTFSDVYIVCERCWKNEISM